MHPTAGGACRRTPLFGPEAGAALDFAVVGYPSRIGAGRARYSMICAEGGGILDELVVYRLAGERFPVVANASNVLVGLTALTGRVAGCPELLDAAADGSLIGGE